jgi:aryl-alcohol dehydrogenase-like predicted oxidoreductase
MASIDGSLKRLRTDHVDLYQIHRFDADTPIEETMEALHDVVKSGKARYIGASTMYAWQFARMLAASERNGWTRFVSMQPQYNPAYREDERELLPLCAAEGIGVLNWSPLAGGFLVHGRARPEDGITERGKTESPLGTPYDNACDRAIFTAISGIAKARGISNATIVYAWLRTRPWITSTLIGATKPGHIAAAVAGLSLELTPGEIEAIETPYRPRAVFGHEVKPH